MSTIERFHCTYNSFAFPTHRAKMEVSIPVCVGSAFCASRGSIAPLARALRPVQAVMASHRGPDDVSGEDEAAASRLLGSWWDD